MQKSNRDSRGRSLHAYSAFADSCPLQTDTLLFSLIIATMSYSPQTGFNSVMKDLESARKLMKLKHIFTSRGKAVL